MIETEGLCRYTSFKNEPFEVHSCLTYALLSRRFNRIRRVILDRIENIAIPISKEIDLYCVDKVLDLYEVAVLLHDVGKLLPIYPLDGERNFFGHEFFSFYILREAFMDRRIVELLGVKQNVLSSMIHISLIPVLLHHSAHRWIFEGKVVRNLLKLAARATRNIDIDSYGEGLARVLERTCLCSDHLYELCRTVAEKACEVLLNIVKYGYRDVVKEIESIVKQIENPYSLGRTPADVRILEAVTPILIAALQLSDRLAAKIIRHGKLQDLDIKTLILFSSL